MIIGIDAHNLEQMRGGAAFRYLANLLEQWKKEINHNFILYFKDNVPSINQLESENFIKKVLKSGIKSNAFFVHFLLPKAAKKDKVEVLFCPYYISPVFYGNKTVVVLHDISYEANPKNFSWPSVWDRILLRMISRRSAKKAKKIITISEFSKNEIIKHYKVSPEKIIVTLLAAEEKFRRLNDIRCHSELPDGHRGAKNPKERGIDEIPHFVRDDFFIDIKNKYGIKSQFILYIGAIFNRRHIPELIKAFENISEKLPEYQLLLVGSNETRPRVDIDGLLKKANIKKEIVKWIKILDENDIVGVYNAASLTVYLSDYEGFGLPVIESMACGTPVLTTNKASLSEIGGDAAIYVNNPGDSDEISKKIYKALTDEDLRSNLIKKGFENIKKFSWEKCAKKTLDAML